MAWRLAALLAAVFATTGFAWAQGGVYVAGQGFSLEQAAEQALREQVGGAPFWIVASGQEARRVVEGEGAHELLARVRERGGIVYACESDLPRAQERTLPQGVGLVGQPEPATPTIVMPAGTETEVLPESVRQNRLILRTCGALQ